MGRPRKPHVEKRHFQCYIPRTTWLRLREHADNTNASYSDVVTHALEAHLDAHEVRKNIPDHPVIPCLEERVRQRAAGNQSSAPAGQADGPIWTEKNQRDWEATRKPEE